MMYAARTDRVEYSRGAIFFSFCRRFFFPFDVFLVLFLPFLKRNKQKILPSRSSGVRLEADYKSFAASHCCPSGVFFVCFCFLSLPPSLGRWTRLPNLTSPIFIRTSFFYSFFPNIISSLAYRTVSRGLFPS